ncbi:MFS transporter [Microlunatus elymi]|uniref:MFS transporter n=1 Tax=Microlunatus elymi TaxID=2596828 RepID=A0A516PWX5_9ACTN|nr:MFS transporter [Microlunatus elymi]QDP95642.1 MFS transporter [Microlunatus elymi]
MTAELAPVPYQPQAQSPLSRPRLAAVLIPSLAFLMVTLDSLVVVTAMPQIHRTLGGSASGMAWIVNAYTLVFAAGIVTGAALGDRFGRRRIFLTGLVIFTLASAACAMAPTLAVLIGVRAMQGFGAALLTPVGLALISAAFPPERRGAAVGIWGGIAGVGVAAGPLVGGTVTQDLNWHWVFWINLPIGVAVFAAALRVLQESRGPARRLDLPGMILVVIAIGLLVDALINVPDAGRLSARTIGLLAAAAAAVLILVVLERRASAPMLPPALFRRRSFLASNLANLLCSAAIFSAAYVTSLYFQLGLGHSPLGTGLRFLPWTAMPLIIAPLAGRWFDRVGARRLAGSGLLLQAVGFCAIAVLAGAGAPWPAFIVAFVAAGAGVSLAIPTLPAAALASVDPDQVGIAAGVTNTMQRIGAVLGIAVITAVFGAHGSLTSPTAVITGFRWAIGAAALISILGAVTTLAIRAADRPGRTRP